MNETRAALLKTAGLSVLPLTLVGVVPALLLQLTGGLHVPRVTAGTAAGTLVAMLGASLNLWSVWGFIYIGRGTPAPIAPPRVLVIDGPFRYVRNPMYIGFLAILLGEALAFGAWVLVAYAGAVFVTTHVLTVRSEEPRLLGTFGEAYREYCEVVPRWIPKLDALKSLR
ncbi:MAG: isoprenylcysteine carboxylmethyltransferase family protein [Candidatus Coatesbacteria bacterium]